MVKDDEGVPEKIVLFGVFFIIGIFLTVIIFALGFDTVGANKLGVMVEMGNIKGIMYPGIKWTGLFTNVYSYDLRTRKTTVELTGANSAVDKTGQAVYATIHVNYRLKPDPETIRSLYEKVGEDNRIEDVLNLMPLISEGFKQTTVKYDSLEIIEKRQEVKEKAIQNIRANFPAQYFEIQDVVITNIDFSQGFKDAIEQKKIAEQQAIKEQNQLEVVKFQQQQEIEKYKAEAEKLRLQKQEITQLLVQQKWVDKWDGKLPNYMLVTPEQSSLIMQLPMSGGTQ